eukprot:GEZU01027434.1.p1 GENE.GEZU01027434.1~~GEZU01027434.1.p1  ORF type:complete len:165 (+),score=8.24 GEZU01027434.1:223-717(+)
MTVRWFGNYLRDVFEFAEGMRGGRSQPFYELLFSQCVPKRLRVSGFLGRDAHVFADQCLVALVSGMNIIAVPESVLAARIEIGVPNQLFFDQVERRNFEPSSFGALRIVANLAAIEVTAGAAKIIGATAIAFVGFASIDVVAASTVDAANIADIEVMLRWRGGS